MKIEEFLLERAKNQLSITTEAIKDGSWFDYLINELKKFNTKSELDDDLPFLKDYISILEKRKDKIIGLGVNSFILLVHKLAMGTPLAAAEIYIQSLGSADLIIKAMDQGTYGLIAAKKELDRLHNDALSLLKEITIEGARHLLPFLISLI